MPHDPTRAQDPYRMALMELTAARHSEADSTRNAHVKLAQIHATLAVAEQLRELRAEYAAGHCPKCRYKTTIGNGERECLNCGWTS